jgi:hypothetical protein
MSHVNVIPEISIFQQMQSAHSGARKPGNPGPKSRPRNYKRTLRSLRAFVITETELRLMAAAAMIGLSKRPVKG